jgi:nucleoside-diphosphate kinase
MERTLIVFKPDAVQRGITGEIIARFEKAGLKIVGAKMMKPNTEHFSRHYEEIGKLATRRGQKTFDMTISMMTEGPVLAMVLEGIEAVELVRKMVGSTEPKSSAPGTIRGDYAHMSYTHADANEIGIPNIIHASGSLEDAVQEIPHWFSDDQIFEYETVYEKFTLKKKAK